MGKTKIILLVVLLLAGINAFTPIIPLPLFIGAIIATQILVLNKYDNAFVLLMLGTVIGAYFAQAGIRFLGVVAIAIGSWIVFDDLKRSFHSWKGSALFILYVLLFLVFSVNITTGGNYATTKLLATFQTAFICMIAYAHLFLFPQKHDGRNLCFMFLIYSFFMIMVMNMLVGSNLSLSEVLSFGAFRDEFSAYLADDANTFVFNYQTIGLYACLGLSLYMLSLEKQHLWDKILVWFLTALVVIFSTSRQTLLIYAILTLFVLMISNKNWLFRVFGILAFAGIGMFWFSSLGAEQQQFIQSSSEFSSESARSMIRLSALNSFSQNPLFGVGYGRFCYGGQYGVNEHNIIYEFLAEFGVIGSLLLVAPLIYVSRPLKRKEIPAKKYLPFFSLLIAYFVHFMVSSHFSEGIVLFIIIPLFKLIPFKNNNI